MMMQVEQEVKRGVGLRLVELQVRPHNKNEFQQQQQQPHNKKELQHQPQLHYKEKKTQLQGEQQDGQLHQGQEEEARQQEVEGGYYTGTCFNSSDTDSGQVITWRQLNPYNLESLTIHQGTRNVLGRIRGKFPRLVELREKEKKRKKREKRVKKNSLRGSK